MMSREVERQIVEHLADVRRTLRHVEHQGNIAFFASCLQRLWGACIGVLEGSSPSSETVRVDLGAIVKALDSAWEYCIAGKFADWSALERECRSVADFPEIEALPGEGSMLTFYSFNLVADFLVTISSGEWLDVDVFAYQNFALLEALLEDRVMDRDDEEAFYNEELEQQRRYLAEVSLPLVRPLLERLRNQAEQSALSVPSV